MQSSWAMSDVPPPLLVLRDHGPLGNCMAATAHQCWPVAGSVLAVPTTPILPVEQAGLLTAAEALALGCVCRLHRHLLSPLRLDAGLHGWVQGAVAGVDLSSSKWWQAHMTRVCIAQKGGGSCNRAYIPSTRRHDMQAVQRPEWHKKTGCDLPAVVLIVHACSLPYGLLSSMAVVQRTVLPHVTPNRTLWPCDTIQCHWEPGCGSCVLPANRLTGSAGAGCATAVRSPWVRAGRTVC